MTCPHCAIAIHDSSYVDIILHLGDDDIMHWIHKSHVLSIVRRSNYQGRERKHLRCVLWEKDADFLDDQEFLAYPLA